jgi:hypothetical protein
MHTLDVAHQDGVATNNKIKKILNQVVGEHTTTLHYFTFIWLELINKCTASFSETIWSV